MSFLPHRSCLLDARPLMWLHIVADLTIAACYFIIPKVLFTARRSLTNFAGRRLLLLFGFFITACGLTHVMDAWTMFHPDYSVQAGMKIVTAALSFLTVISLFALAKEHGA